MRALQSLVLIVRRDLVKFGRFAAVSVVTVPLGLFLLWFFLDVTEMQPVIANLLAVTIATIPNYLLNRYWVWEKRTAHSLRFEIAPFWIIALLGAVLSSSLIWIAHQFTDASIVYLLLNLFSFGVMWLIKFFVLERYLFGSADAAREEVAV